MPHARATLLATALGLLAIAAAPAARAQLGPGGFADPCRANVSVFNPQYLGKQGGLDSIQVFFVGPAALGPGGPLGLTANKAAVCGVPEGLTGQYQIALTVERKLGHRDSGSASVNGPLGSTTQQRVVQVPRAALETDPKKYELQVTGSVLGLFTTTARVAGSGGLALVNGAALTTTTTPPALPQGCTPTFSVNALGLATPDSATVSWSAPPLAALCLKSSGSNVVVKLVRADGSSLVRSANAPPGATSVVVPLGQPAGQVVSYEVTVSMPTTSTLKLEGSAEGEL